MSGLYIHGMEMPTFRDDYVAIVIYGNGTIRSVHGYVIDGATAVPVPPHGDLVERQAVLNTFSTHTNRTMHYVTIRDAIPTIIPAEEE